MALLFPGINSDSEWVKIMYIHFHVPILYIFKQVSEVTYLFTLLGNECIDRFTLLKLLLHFNK